MRKENKTLTYKDWQPKWYQLPLTGEQTNLLKSQIDEYFQSHQESSIGMDYRETTILLTWLLGCNFHEDIHLALFQGSPLLRVGKRNFAYIPLLFSSLLHNPETLEYNTLEGPKGADASVVKSFYQELYTLQFPQDNTNWPCDIKSLQTKLDRLFFLPFRHILNDGSIRVQIETQIDTNESL